MRTARRMASLPPEPHFPLLESGDLPGSDSWLLIDSFGNAQTDDLEPDRFGALSLAPSYDD